MGTENLTIGKIISYKANLEKKKEYVPGVWMPRTEPWWQEASV